MGQAHSAVLLTGLFLLKSTYADTNHTIRTFPNWWYLGEGYHLLCGNTEPTYLGTQFAFDPGWRPPVISLNIRINTTSNDTKYHIPGNTEADYIGSQCNLNSQTTLYHGDISLSNDLFSQIKWYKDSNDEDNLNKTAFVASPTFKKYHSKMYEQPNNRILVSADGKCPTYNYFFKPQVPFTLTDEFVIGFSALTVSPTAASCWVFLDTWGTHVVTDIYSGSRYSRIHQFDNNAWNAMNWNKFDIPFLANVEYDLYATNDTNKYNSTIKNQVNTFTKLAEAIYQSLMGIRPLRNLLNWLNISTVNPFPWQYTMIPIVDLMIPEYFPHLIPHVVNNTRQRVIDALQTYSKHLLCADLQVSCPPHQNDVPLPTQIQSNSRSIQNNGTETCGDYYHAVSCGFTANIDGNNNDFDKFWSVYPEYDAQKQSVCAGEDRYGAELYATCVAASAINVKISSSVFTTATGSAQCTTSGWVVTGCGMIPKNPGNGEWDPNKAMYPDPESQTKCVCQHKYGGTCYALCADNILPEYVSVIVNNGGPHNLSCPTDSRILGCGIELLGDTTEPSRPSFYAANTLTEQNICVGYYKQGYKLYAICSR